MPLSIVGRLAGHLYRKPEDRRPSAWETRWKYALYVGVLGAAIGLIAYLISLEAMHWRNAYPEVPLAANNWMLLENPPQAECAKTGKVSVLCPASPENPALWRNGTSRFDETGQRKRKAKKDFWIGAEFTPEMMSHAYRALANQLLLGWVFCDYDLFVNGQWLKHGSGAERNATVIPIPLNSFASEKPLKIAVLIHADSEGGAPDYFAAPWKEGLATSEQASAFVSANVFWHSDKPFGLFLVSFVFSLLFFLFWRLQTQKQEYFFLALYGAAAALKQIQGMDFYRGTFDLAGTHALYMFLYIAEAGFGFFASLAFSRARYSFFRSVPLLLMIPWCLMLLPIGVPARAHLLWQIRSWVVPSFYYAGALVCILQAWRLIEIKGQFSTRSVHLLFFTFGMALIGTLEVFETRSIISLTTQAFTSGFTHFSVIFLLAAIALQEYKDERILLERSPISKYHRREQLPSSVCGALLCVDLKNSEFLSHESATGTGDSGLHVRTCLSHMWSAVLAEKGSVLSTEGDGLHAFFDADDCPNPTLSGLHAVDQIRKRLSELARQLHAQGLHNGNDFGFRAGLALGEIKPVWQEAGSGKVAGWSDSGKGTLFVETARLMEIERQTGSADEQSQVVMEAETAFALRGDKSLQGKWTLEGKSFVGKHGHTYLVSLYSSAIVRSETENRAAG